jgi:hypothetical protein
MRVNCLMTRFVTVGERIVLQHESACAGAKGFIDVLVEVERRQDQDSCAFICGQDAPRRLESVEFGHPDIHQHDGRAEPRGLVDRFEAVARLGYDFDVVFAREQHPKAGADHRLVVGDEDSDAHCRSLLSGSRVLSTKPPPFADPAVISPP